MSGWTKEELENMLQDVVNELVLSDEMLEKHGPLGTAPAELVGLVIDKLLRRIVELEKDTVSKCVALRDIGDANIRLFSAIHRARMEYIAGPFDDDAIIPKGFCLLRKGAIQQLLSCTSITAEALKEDKP